ncbi:hypothetical protein AMATHDRAFT_75326 [Amanita thiersii Skay4041]|uniref:Pterin-binding domain-containing protein n=1 Tax=Amanita thiersii Skay4041 TaxID=703135 RepID=A0A2A9NIN3_9AGAR|nr:hypothetical protein AMATHDRAFT_75326 [Amanita thiersii Skay4041]
MASLHTVVIALGSNLGDRFRNIELALRLLEHPTDVFVSLNDGRDSPAESSAIPQDASLDIINTSFMYETAPMYVKDQSEFINCACIVETNLEPLQLLKLLKRIEECVGRVPSKRYGPRIVDLDIIFFDNEVIDTRSLVIPHPRIAEREFVLRPVSDMIPDYEHPLLRKTIKTLLSELKVTDILPMCKVVPFPRYPIPIIPSDEPDELSGSYPQSVGYVPPTLTYWKYQSRSTPQASPRSPNKSQTHIMAIINMTPDSFSDGSLYDTSSAALERARESISAGATILDVGGYSTRPGAGFVSVDEEIMRVKLLIDEVRQTGAAGFNLSSEEEVEDSELTNVLMSVDTFRPEVAKEAIQSGVNCINDVYSFTGPGWWKSMKQVARDHAVPVVLMHSRGDAGKNKIYDMYSYAEEKVVEAVRVELGNKVDRIVKGKGGVRRWFVIVDVGIGFSKKRADNLTLLRKSNRRRNPLAGFPQLVGASRKAFLGEILAKDGKKVPPRERCWATAATVACSVQQGALAVRVHDVKEMVDVVRISEAIWT